MSSAVYYRFKSGRELKRFAFDGTGVSVFELKRGILLQEKLDQTADSFNLTLSNPDTGGVYDDDSEIVPRSSSVVAARTPVNRAGAYYAAARYVTGSLTVNAKNASRKEATAPEPAAAADDGLQFFPASNAAGSGTEADMMSAMFAAQGAQWSQTQQEMAAQVPIYHNRARAPEADKTVPPGYICNRCGHKGHWISQCPALYDPTWETKKVRRTTGIPKAMLRTVKNPGAGDDGKTYLMNADGEYVVALADEKSWTDFQNRQLQQQQKNSRPVPDDLKDALTGELLRSPSRMPCCGAVYSEAAIENALIQNDFKCPNCGKEDVYIDQLQPDADAAARLREFEGPDAAGAAAAPSDDDKYDLDADLDMPDYSPKRRGSASSVESVGSRASEGRSGTPNRAAGTSNSAPTGTSKPAEASALPMMMPMMMPYMFNPFMMPLAFNAQEKEHESKAITEEDDLARYTGPVIGRIR